MKEKKKEKKVKETFEIGSFTERGAMSLRKTYESLGYKFLSYRMAENTMIMQKFCDKD